MSRRAFGDVPDVNINRAISLTVSPKKRTKAEGANYSPSVPAPRWWVASMNARFTADKMAAGMTLQKLGVALAEKVKRDEPFSHPTIYKFFQGATTRDVCDAFAAYYPDVPGYVFYPEDELEAALFEQARIRAAAIRRQAAIGAQLSDIDRQTDRAASLDAQEDGSGAGEDGRVRARRGRHRGVDGDGPATRTR